VENIYRKKAVEIKKKKTKQECLNLNVTGNPTTICDAA
jgi:hypothetical protein